MGIAQWLVPVQEDQMPLRGVVGEEEDEDPRTRGHRPTSSSRMALSQMELDGEAAVRIVGVPGQLMYTLHRSPIASSPLGYPPFFEYSRLCLLRV